MRKLIQLLFGILLSCVPAAVSAQMANPCAYVGGCGPANVLALAVGPVANLLVSVAAGLSVVFVVVGGALMLTSLGEEGQIQKGKMSIVYALVGLGITLLAQSIAAFVGTQFGGLMGSSDPVFHLMGYAVNAMVILFNAVFALMMVASGFRMAFARGSSDEFTKARGIIIWAVVGAIVVNVAQALVVSVMNLPL
ncbi:hypothetical protein KKC44_04165 [Patescibacteria group bacterium]|nr:hypothetical protein [Patescibacteria group bacterium]MBU2259776.1 hypothetical protein [Patescibacteria group bacterium]